MVYGNKYTALCDMRIENSKSNNAETINKQYVMMQ